MIIINAKTKVETQDNIIIERGNIAIDQSLEVYSENSLSPSSPSVAKKTTSITAKLIYIPKKQILDFLFLKSNIVFLLSQ